MVFVSFDWVSIGSSNGLSAIWCQAPTSASVDLLSNEFSVGTKFLKSNTDEFKTP